MYANILTRRFFIFILFYNCSPYSALQSTLCARLFLRLRREDARGTVGTGWRSAASVSTLYAQDGIDELGGSDVEEEDLEMEHVSSYGL